MIRLCQGKKLKYISLGISVHPEYWDFEKNKPKPNCPNREHIETIISNKLNEYNLKILEYKVEKKDFTTSILAEKVEKSINIKTVNETFLMQIKRLFAENRNGYALSYKQVFNSLLEFNTHLDIYFSDIDVTWLRKYETWLRN